MMLAIKMKSRHLKTVTTFIAMIVAAGILTRPKAVKVSLAVAAVAV